MNEKLILNNEVQKSSHNMKKNNSNGLDQFYTKPDIALKCYHKLQELTNIHDYDTHLEPSAGSGSFYDLMDETKRVGLDIEPQKEGIVQMDFFQYQPIEGNRYLTIGNPPFGRVSSLAVQFFNKSAEFSDCIAFIIPRTFKRVSIQNKLDLNFKLIYNEDLPIRPCCFTPNMTAKCCFQIWIKTEEKRQVVEYKKSHPDFTFMKHGPKDHHNQPTPPTNADFALKAYGSHCGEIVDTDLDTLRPKSWHWIRSNIDVNTLKKRFKQLDYSMSEDTVRQDSLGQQELIYLYILKFGE